MAKVLLELEDTPEGLVLNFMEDPEEWDPKEQSQARILASAIGAMFEKRIVDDVFAYIVSRLKE